MDDPEYDNTHRAFLQAFLARQTLTFDQARPILAKILSAHDPARPVLDNDVSQEDFSHYVEGVSRALSPFDFEIRSQLHQQTKERVYALVNVSEDALTQMATTHSADEIAFVKRVLDAMFVNYNTRRQEIMAVTGMQAIKLHKAPAASATASTREVDGDETQTQRPSATAANQSLTQTQAEAVINSLQAEGWFERSPNGYFSLSPRALMELRNWLIDTYNDREDLGDSTDDSDEDLEPHQKIKFCQACKDIVTIGARCPDLRCEGRLHTHCVRNMFRAQGGREECPVCSKAWGEALPVGEKAASTRGTTTNGPTGAVGPRRRTSNRVGGLNRAADSDDRGSETG